MDVSFNKLASKYLKLSSKMHFMCFYYLCIILSFYPENKKQCESYFGYKITKKEAIRIKN